MFCGITFMLCCWGKDKLNYRNNMICVIRQLVRGFVDVCVLFTKGRVFGCMDLSIHGLLISNVPINKCYTKI